MVRKLLHSVERAIFILDLFLFVNMNKYMLILFNLKY
jgi:hypothetical protein